MKMKFSGLGWALVVFAMPVLGQGNMAATDADLRGSFCLQRIQEFADLTENIYQSWPNETRPPKVIQANQAASFKLNKLRFYLQARALSLNASALIEIATAKRSGENAVQLSGQVAVSCMGKFPNWYSDDPVLNSDGQQCIRAAIKDFRLDQCDDLSFLPY